MKIEVTPFMRAHRGLKKCPRFVFKKDLSDFRLEQLERIDASIREIIGCYYNVERDEGSLSFVLCEQGICSLSGSAPLFSAFRDILTIDFLAGEDSRQTEHLEIVLFSGESRHLSIKGGDPKFGTKDTFACVVPFQHIVSDLRKQNQR